MQANGTPSERRNATLIVQGEEAAVLRRLFQDERRRWSYEAANAPLRADRQDARVELAAAERALRELDAGAVTFDASRLRDLLVDWAWVEENDFAACGVIVAALGVE